MLPVEVCLSSSMYTSKKTRRRGLARHPAASFYEFGLRVTLNTDSRLVCNTSMTHELWLAVTQLGFTMDDVKDVIVNGYKSAFLPLREKEALLLSVLPELGLPVPRGAGRS